MSVSTFMGLQTALRGLLAHQRSIETTSHNIANANTVGYTRQEAVIETTPAFTKAKAMEGMRGGSAKRLGEAKQSLKDFPLRTKIDMKTGGNAITMSNEVLDVRESAVPKDVLAVPSGYAKTTPRGMPGPPPPAAR